MFQFPEFAPYSYEFTARLLSFLIQKSPDRSLVADSPELIAGSHVFRRFLMPRHPPCTLSNLTTFIDHRHEKYFPTHSTPRIAPARSTRRSAPLPPGVVDSFRQALRPADGSTKVIYHRKGARRDTQSVLGLTDSRSRRFQQNCWTLNLNLIINLSKSSDRRSAFRPHFFQLHLNVDGNTVVTVYRSQFRQKITQPQPWLFFPFESPTLGDPQLS